MAPFKNATSSVTEADEPWTYYFLQLFCVYPLAAAIGCGLRLFEVFYGKRLDWNERFLIFWAVAFMGYMGMATPHKEPRYILPVTLPLMVISARGFGILLEKRR